jgi:hypothetical protein
MKKGIRILAIDDSPFSKGDRDALIVGVIGRADGDVEGVVSSHVAIDGTDATKKIVAMVRGSRFSGQVKLIALHGIALVGLNVVDIIGIGRELKMPVVIVVRKKPHEKKLANAIRLSGNGVARKLSALKDIRENSELVRRNGFYLRYAGMTKKEVAEVQDSAARFLRLAHIIASGVAGGESKGRI